MLAIPDLALEYPEIETGDVMRFPQRIEIADESISKNLMRALPLREVDQRYFNNYQVAEAFHVEEEPVLTNIVYRGGLPLFNGVDSSIATYVGHHYRDYGGLPTQINLRRWFSETVRFRTFDHTRRQQIFGGEGAYSQLEIAYQKLSWRSENAALYGQSVNLRSNTDYVCTVVYDENKTVDGIYDAFMYLNGSLIDARTMNTAGFGWFASPKLFGLKSNGSNPFDGYIWDYMLHARALKPAEIAELHAGRISPYKPV